MKFSIITAVHNNRDEVGLAMDSVLSQEHGDVEYIVVDGASTDGTLNEIEKRRNRIDILISEPDSGIYDALNKGITAATGDVIGFLHSDDLYPDPTILSQVDARFAEQDYDAIYGNLQYVDKDGLDRVIRHWQSCPFTPELLPQGWMPPHPTFFVRRTIYQESGNFNTAYRIAADYDLMLRFLSRPGFSAAYLPQVLVKMRVGGASNRSVKNILRKSYEDYQALRRNDIGGIGALIRKNTSKIKQFF
ncbi:MAG: glycosyltransferase family 2 protein [Planctomycetota bacterium]